MRVTKDNADYVIEYHAPGPEGLANIGIIRVAALAFIMVLLTVEEDTAGAEARDLEADEKEAIVSASQEFIRVILNSSPFSSDRSMACHKVMAAQDAALAPIVREKYKTEPEPFASRIQDAIRFAREAMMTANAAVVLRGLI